MQHSNIRSHSEEVTLKHDINTLLLTFNELDYMNAGTLSKSQLSKMLSKIGIDIKDYYKLQIWKDNDAFEFDGVLSLLGWLEVPEEPAVYVISFVKILAAYRNKCIEGGQEGLKDAGEIDQKIKKICKKELERQRDRLLHEHNKIYDEMNRTQESQFHNFEEEWKKYLEEFKNQTQEKVYRTKVNKIKELSFESQKMVKSARRHSIVTSSKLRELLEKKKWLVKEGKYADAIKINYLIQEEKKKIEEHNEESLDFAFRKRVKTLKKKNETAMSYMQDEMTTNMHKLLHKKKEGENLMKIKMKNLREEAQRKLNEHLRGELTKIRASFLRASRH